MFQAKIEKILHRDQREQSTDVPDETRIQSSNQILDMVKQMTSKTNRSMIAVKQNMVFNNRRSRLL